jgi:hypothetical protein
MSDDVFEAFGDDDIFAEDEEELKEAEGEGSNRVFIIAVAVLGGLLVCALISFGVWALVINPRQQAQQQVSEAVPTATATLEPTATEEVIVWTDTPEPTETPKPTATPLLGPTHTATPEEGGAMAAAGEDAEPTATSAPRRTATPTRTPRPTATPIGGSGETSYGASSGELSQTGLGEWLMVGGAVMLLAVVILARRLRSA